MAAKKHSSTRAPRAQQSTAALPLTSPEPVTALFAGDDTFTDDDNHQTRPIIVNPAAAPSDLVGAAYTRIHRIVNQLQFATLATDNDDVNVIDFLHAVLGQAQELERLLERAVEVVHHG